MELRQLRYFVAVAEALSFRQAATRLRVAQPSLSAQVAKLEKELGTRLFDRDRRHVALTAAGTATLEEAREILARVEVVARRARDAASGRTGELHIGHIELLTQDFLPRCLAEFHRASPQTAVTLHDLCTPDQWQRLADGEINVGFLSTPFPALPRQRRFTIHRLLSDPLMLMINSRHPLAAQAEASLDELKEETFLHVRVDDRDGHRAKTEALCLSHGFRARLGQEVESMESLVGLVAASQGVALVPALSRRPAAECAFVPLAESPPDNALYLVWGADGGSLAQRHFHRIVLHEATMLEQTLAAPAKSRADGPDTDRVPHRSASAGDDGN